MSEEGRPTRQFAAATECILLARKHLDHARDALERAHGHDKPDNALVAMGSVKASVEEAESLFKAADLLGDAARS